MDKDQDFSVRPASGAFQIFPKETWGKILDEVVDWEDIHNTLRAFPELEEAYESKKSSRLSGLVLPHLIMKYLVHQETDHGKTVTRSPDLLNMRRVSKGWKNCVENALENYSNRRPLLPRGTSKSESSLVALPENHFNYHRIRWKHPLKATIFNDAWSIDAFLKEMGDCTENPFPTRSVLLSVSDLLIIGDDDDDDDDDTSEMFPQSNLPQAVEKTVVLLERFGQHVFDLEIQYSDPWDLEDINDLELCCNLLRCLSFVPNLRSFILTGNLFQADSPDRENFFRNPESQNLFPELPNLERFEWRVRFDSGESTWIKRMLETYGKKEGLRKLAIPINLFWTTDLKSCQEIHLTELHLLLNVDGNIDRIVEVLRAIPNNEGIRKLWLSSLGGLPDENKIQSVKIDKLVQILAGFQFESVVLQDLRLDSILLEPVPQQPVPTVTSIDLEEIGVSFRSYEFLRRLPCLKSLTIFVNYRTIELFCMTQRFAKKDLKTESIYQKLRRYILKVCNPKEEIPDKRGIWKEIPSLEMLTVVVEVDKERMRKYVGAKFVKECGNKAFFWNQIQHK